VSADFKRRLMEEAAKDKRSVTNYLEVTLTRYWETTYLDAHEEKKKRVGTCDFREARQPDFPPPSRELSW